MTTKTTKATMKGKKMSKKVNLKTHKWIKTPFNKGYVLVSKEYLKQFKKKGEKNE